MARWTARLRAAAPGWGIVYDPWFCLWVAVRGWDQLIVASTPPTLLWRIIRAEIRNTVMSPPKPNSKSR